MADFDDRFCVYCQEEYESIEGLVEHIEEEHQKTYAYYNIAVPWRKKHSNG